MLVGFREGIKVGVIVGVNDGFKDGSGVGLPLEKMVEKTISTMGKVFHTLRRRTAKTFKERKDTS